MIRFAFALSAALVVAGLASVPPALADEPVWRHASALNGEPRYPADFKHFDYVNPDAPKGGTVRFGVEGGFDSTNVYLGTKGDPASAVAQVYEALTTESLDEYNISATYGLLADKLRYPDDYAWVDYHLNPAARWSDGQPVTADDVIWSFTTLKDIYPLFASYYGHVVKAEDAGDNVIHFTFDAPGNRELPHIVGQLPVLPRHWWEGKDASGKPRDIRATTLEAPMGSGPYKVTSVDAGRQIVLERDPNYWGKDLPVNAGINNFDRMSYEYFLDPTVLLEAFKGDKYDFRLERSAKMWATAYDFPAKTEGRVVTETYPKRGVGVMQALVVNLRLPKYQDARVRSALNYAFDYETLKHNVFYDQYDRINSYYFGTELASSGLPSAEELKLLEPLKDQIPASVFTTPYTNPLGGSPEALRKNLREAIRLFGEAGWTLQDGVMKNAKGEAFTIEFKTNDQLSERYVAPYAKALKLIGIDLVFRVVDDAQYQNVMDSFSFDMTTGIWGETLSPGNEQRENWGSAAADKPGSRNHAGIKNAAVDKLIDAVIFAQDRPALVTATHALDRVLLANNFVIPLFYSLNDRIAYWNRFSHPDKLPEYSVGFPTVWWYDAAKASATGGP
ncbi:extracellular solute-binding protein [Oryzibacter oryziterrae]|uniref:extracellular solute-binding protein n=1 Tax=Oryzibacter oryziterrae TaxID=2766474 RepID=UPI001F297CE4|nr:extracellular solute-binding protein [Oryzibacter oryziterrae]